MEIVPDLTRISHREIRKIVIIPVLLRCGVGSDSVTYRTVCFLTTRSPRLVLQAFSRFSTCAGEKCRLSGLKYLSDFYKNLFFTLVSAMLYKGYGYDRITVCADR